MVDAGPKYLAACALHDRLSALFPKVQAAQVRIRKPLQMHAAVRPAGKSISTDRDLIVVSLVTKAVTTHRAIRVLTDAGLASDATVLYRALLENAVLLEWLLQQPHGLDLYALSGELLRTRMAEASVRYYGDKPEFQAQSRLRANRHRELVQEVFGETSGRWARRLTPGGTLDTKWVSLEGIFGDVVDGPNSTPGKKNVISELVYAEASWYAHSYEPSLNEILRARRGDTYFRLEPFHGDELTRVQALHGANIQGLVAISILNTYAHLELDDEVDSLQGAIKEAIFQPDSETL